MPMGKCSAPLTEKCDAQYRFRLSAFQFHNGSVTRSAPAPLGMGATASDAQRGHEATGDAGGLE